MIILAQYPTYKSSIHVSKLYKTGRLTDFGSLNLWTVWSGSEKTHAPVSEVVCGICDAAVARHGRQGEEGSDGDIGGGLDLLVAVVDGKLEVVD